MGESDGSVDVARVVADLGLDGLVTHLGRVDGFQTFIDWVHTVDVVLNLRYPTLGESSAAALRAMAAGRPLIVFDHGWYSEIADEACVKVPVMGEGALVVAMLELGQSAARREALGEGAIEYIERVCAPTAVAQAYVDFIERYLANLAGKYA